MSRKKEIFRLIFKGLFIGSVFSLLGCQQGYLVKGPTVVGTVGRSKMIVARKETKPSGDGGEKEKAEEAKEKKNKEDNDGETSLKLEQIKKELEAAKVMVEETQKSLGEAKSVQLEIKQELRETRRQLSALIERMPEKVTTHEVVKGESLWKIAGYKHIYNDPYKWLEIYNANKDKIIDPNTIYPGQVLVIPRYQ